MNINPKQELAYFNNILGCKLIYHKESNSLNREKPKKYIGFDKNEYAAIPIVIDGESPYTKQEVLELFARMSEVYPIVLQKLIELESGR